MKRRSDNLDDWDALRTKIIGLGEQSIQKSYYPQLQRKLEELELFRSLLDHSIDIIFLIRVPTGALMDANESACNILGYSREALLSMKFMDLFSPSESHKIRDLFSHHYVTKTAIQITALLSTVPMLVEQI